MSDETFESVIGLEVHCQLLTGRRLFSGGPIDKSAGPNSRVTAYDIGLPGTLPVLDDGAVDLALRAGLALDSTIHRRSRFDRKHYFYPDLPKGYQITQYEQPLCTGGELVFDHGGETRSVPIERIHLEEDAGKSMHVDGRRLVDFNRAGVPLIEVVTEPTLESPGEAEAALRALHRLVVHLGICDGNLAEGSFRCDANISLRLVDTSGGDKTGPKTELKNLNSFRFVRQALAAEIERQQKCLDDGDDRLVDETRSYDPEVDRTKPMRTKETSPDYRYVPDPDLPVLQLDADRIDGVRDGLPELPRRRRRRFVETLELSPEDAATLTDPPSRADFFDRAVESSDNPVGVAHFIINEMLARLDGEATVAALDITAEEVAKLVSLVDDGVISSSAATAVLDELLVCDESPETIVDRLDLRQLGSREALEELVDDVLADEPGLVARYRDGEQNLLGHFMGQVMKASQGRADPQKASAILREILDE